MADLDLEDEDIEDVSPSRNASKRNIPLHQDLPKDHNKKKEEPATLKEVQFVDQRRPQQESRVEAKISEEIFKMFEDRVEELESLKRLVKLLKNFIKRYKQAIINMQLADIDKTEKLVKEKRKLQRDYEKYQKEEHARRIEEITIELTALKDRAIDLNVKHFVNLSDE